MIDRDQTGWREILLENFRWGNEDCIPALESLSSPLRAINSENTPTATEIIKKYNPSFELRLVRGSGHVLMWDATETFNQLLEETIQDILSQG
jgi:pimeloyl-ACP methyl ester carboxylesterase